MKAVNVILKIVAALAAIAGIVYVVATYGDKIVAWVKKMLGKLGCLCDNDCGCCCQCDEDCDECPCEEDCDQCPCDCCCDDCEEEAAEEAEDAAEDAPAEEAVSAEEADFEG